MLPHYSKSYKQSAVQTASPGQLVLMLFDGALKFMMLAEHGFEVQGIRERNEAISNNLIKAQNILAELQSTLDLKVEGQFPHTMYQLYNFMLTQLQDANIKKAKPPIKTVYRLLKEIRDAWAEMLTKVAQKTSEEAAETAKKDEDADPEDRVGGGLNVSA